MFVTRSKFQDIFATSFLEKSDSTENSHAKCSRICDIPQHGPLDMQMAPYLWTAWDHNKLLRDEWAHLRSRFQKHIVKKWQRCGHCVSEICRSSVVHHRSRLTRPDIDRPPKNIRRFAASFKIVCQNNHALVNSLNALIN